MPAAVHTGCSHRRATRSTVWTTLLVLALWAATPSAGWAHDPAEEMATAATRLLASLPAEQQALAVFPLADSERTNWHFIPDFAIEPRHGRAGLRLDAMSDASQLYTHGLLNAALSHRGYLTATSIMALEKVLAELEQDAEKRDPGRYYLCIFGTPAATGTWAWRFEGHHMSLNITIRDGKMFSVTPTFFGSNPGEVRQGAHEGMQVLAPFEQLAFDLLATLTPAQTKLAVVSPAAPKEVLTSDQPQVDRQTLLPQVGLPSTEMTPAQQKLLLTLVQTYAAAYRPEILAKTTHAQQLDDPSGWTFAWYGATAKGGGHYYRIQSATFVLEFANVQNNANHIHAVWRDFDGDFGRDLLGEHFREGHEGTAKP